MVSVGSGRSLVVEMKLRVEYVSVAVGLFSYYQLLQNSSTPKNYLAYVLSCFKSFLSPPNENVQLIW
jgi:hypothetical protein